MTQQRNRMDEQKVIRKTAGAWKDEHGWWHYACPRCQGAHVAGACPRIWDHVEDKENDPIYQMYGPHTYY